MKTELYTTEQVLNKDMGFNMSMNRYVAKDGREAIMHNNKTHVKTTDGTEWTLASTIVTVANKGIPQATAESVKTTVPDTKCGPPHTEPVKPVTPTAAPTTVVKK